MSIYRIVAGGTIPESWVMERVADQTGPMEPLMVFDTYGAAYAALYYVVLKQVERFPGSQGASNS